MIFNSKKGEAKNLRKILSVKQLPIDEGIYCSVLSNGRVDRFNKLSTEEIKEIKRQVTGFTHEELLLGIYAMAYEMNILQNKNISDNNDQKIINYLRSLELISFNNQLSLKTANREVITIVAPFTRQSFFTLVNISLLLSQVYLMRSSKLN